MAERHPDLVANDRLVRLSSQGCRLPGVQVACAYYMRAVVWSDLSEATRDTPFAQKAIEAACNTHPNALWWMQHSRHARELITEEASRLYASCQRGEAV
jgi:hypothetical protein